MRIETKEYAKVSDKPWYLARVWKLDAEDTDDVAFYMEHQDRIHILKTIKNRYKPGFEYTVVLERGYYREEEPFKFEGDTVFDASLERDESFYEDFTEATIGDALLPT